MATPRDFERLLEQVRNLPGPPTRGPQAWLYQHPDLFTALALVTSVLIMSWAISVWAGLAVLCGAMIGYGAGHRHGFIQGKQVQRNFDVMDHAIQHMHEHD